MFKQNGQGKAGHDHSAIKPLRCLCGSMLARLVPGGVELKCRRCKRQVIVPLERNRPAKVINEV
jgi:phage FluMu protein Com